MTFDKWKVESGLLDNVDVTFTDAVFTNRLDAFKPEQLELHITCLTPDGEQVLYFGCGDGWITEDGGKTAIREDGKERNFHQNSKIGELFRSLVRVMGNDAAADKAMRAHGDAYDLGPREAGFWTGLQVHLAREERKGSGEISDYEVVVIDGFNGIEGAGGAKKATAKKAAPAKAAAKKAAPKEKAGLDDELRARLDELADACGTHDEFMERAIAEIPEAGEPVVKEAIADDGEGSIWADAVARYEASQA